MTSLPEKGLTGSPMSSASTGQALQSSITVQSKGQTVLVGGIPYFLPGKPSVSFAVPEGDFPLDTSSSQLFPITVMVSESETVSVKECEAIVERFSAVDDVWTSSFLETTIFRTTSNSSYIENERLKVDLIDKNFMSISSLQIDAAISSLPEGPYFLAAYMNAWNIYKAFRLYSDVNYSFYYGVMDSVDGNFEVVSAVHPFTDGATTIAVPSRLYFAPPSVEKPLSGVRIGVKDLYDLKGLKTSMGSRAWARLYDPAKETAVAVQRLIDLGGVIIGKTRTSQFGNGESPTLEWVDFHDSFNPRADGYQDPSGSSAGAGSAEASYDWVDMNIGSDTGGSIRAPAGVSGVFGNRPSQGGISLTGVLSVSTEMDTAAFVARTAKNFSTFGKAWYGANPMFKSCKSFPSKIIYPIDTIGIDTTKYPSPGFFPAIDDNAQALFDTFVSKLESFLGTTKTVYDFYTEYKDTSGSGLYPPDHVGEVWTKLTSYHLARKVWNPFFADYARANDGDHPYLDPPVKRNYAFGLKQTDEDFERIIASKSVFQEWVRSQLLPSSDSCSSAILVNPIVTGSRSGRDDVYMKTAPTVENAYLGWNRYGISQLSGVPEVVIPLGSVPFLSPVTGTIKQSPVAVSLLAGYGCDFMLYDLVEALAEKGIIPAAVKTGPVM